MVKLGAIVNLCNIYNQTPLDMCRGRFRDHILSNLCFTCKLPIFLNLLKYSIDLAELLNSDLTRIPFHEDEAVAQANRNQTRIFAKK